MTNLWATESILMKKLGQTFEEEDHQISISNLSYSKGDINFDLSHYSPWMGKMVTESIKTELLWDTNDLDNEWTLQELQHLREAREHLLQNYVAKGLEGVTMMVLGTFAPELAIVASLGVMAVNGSAGSVTGLDSQVSSLAGKLGIKSGNLLTQNIINYGLAVSNLDASLTEANYQAKMEWFGLGGTYAYDGGIWGEIWGAGGDIGMTGMYKPEVIRQVKVWEEEGIAGWIGWDQADVDAIADAIKLDANLKDDERKACEKLLTGGYNITEEEDMVAFMNRIKVIQGKYRDLDSKTDNVNIQHEWRDIVD